MIGYPKRKFAYDEAYTFGSTTNKDRSLIWKFKDSIIVLIFKVTIRR